MWGCPDISIFSDIFGVSEGGKHVAHCTLFTACTQPFAMWPETQRPRVDLRVESFLFLQTNHILNKI